MFTKQFFIWTLVVSAFYIRITHGKVFPRCELARILYFEKFPRDLLPDWMCLIRSESNFNSTAVGGPNQNGSFDYGLFQINENYWCGDGGLSNDCNIPCEKLIDDDILDDIECVRIIYRRHNFTAWNGWKARCQEPTSLIAVDDCFYLKMAFAVIP